MKAIVWTKYGSPDGLHLQEVAKPAIKDHELLIKVHATTVTAGDTEVRQLKFPVWLWVPMRLWLGLIQPRSKILGQELSGEVEAVGQAVTDFKPGDAVFGTTGIGFGAYAEYIRLPAESSEGVLGLKPANMSYEEAAAVPVAGLEALHYLRKGALQPGQKVLIVGAGGSIGTYGVQLAKYFGAEVTGVDSGPKLDMLRAIGADHVIDYTREDFTRNGETYDVIFDVIGGSVYGRSLRSLKPNGRYLLANPKLSQMVRGLWASLTSSKRVIFGAVSQKPEDLAFLRELIEAGDLKAIIDRCYPLEQTAEAHRYVDSGQKQGNVVISVVQDSPA